ncbi:type III pantothenate kinase [Rickettsiales endosymbiont of Stachyamoeba lipophora]|uniref:type III pantothenate kinase n=1 Tax=Rickettsiales endosymbiont of Stachyamoeba lipophora TaxID=2486578 RepID=UPI000F64E591|nr:type III pantothenate kinase [Rickettsiales endosymbiont of Stachyamoeba lipophora]AZL15993.1 type III pantothenate kinase [Rickettsiales endosymbiont of Stachyamoeba lipophora]
MLLALDIGNTNIVGGIFNNSYPLVRSFRIETYTETNLKDELAHSLDSANIHKNKITAIIVSSVVPKLTTELIKILHEYFGVYPLLVAYNLLKIDIEINKSINPLEVGTDLLCNLVAAKHKYGNNTLIIDCGTATTFCILNKNQVFDGAFILPGVKGFNNVLSEHTSLPIIEFKEIDFELGINTESAIQVAAFHGYVGMITNLINLVQSKYNNQLRIIVTGGNSVYFKTQNFIDFYEPDLTLNGLVQIYIDNNNPNIKLNNI